MDDLLSFNILPTKYCMILAKLTPSTTTALSFLDSSFSTLNHLVKTMLTVVGSSCADKF